MTLKVKVNHPPPPPPKKKKKKKEKNNKTIGTLTKVYYIYGSNLVILASTGLELSRGQTSDWHTDGQTDTGNDKYPMAIQASGKKSNFYCFGRYFCFVMLIMLYRFYILV